SPPCSPSSQLPHLPYLPPFPTRRSSDLARCATRARPRRRSFLQSFLSRLPVHFPLFGTPPPVLRLQRCNKKGKVNWQTGQETLRSEEHTSELQSLAYLVCRLLLEKKNNL